VGCCIPVIPALRRLRQPELHIKNLRAQGTVLMPVIPATQEAEIRRIVVQISPGQIFVRPYLKKTHHEKGWWSGSGCRP
jgi:hypothetical protein